MLRTPDFITEQGVIDKIHRHIAFKHAGTPPRTPRLFVRPGKDDFSVEPVGGSMTPDRRRSGDTLQYPHERTCVDITPSGRRAGSAIILI
jgi:hypothetical protein